MIFIVWFILIMYKYLMPFIKRIFICCFKVEIELIMSNKFSFIINVKFNNKIIHSFININNLIVNLLSLILTEWLIFIDEMNYL